MSKHIKKKYLATGSMKAINSNGGAFTLDVVF